MPSDISSKLVFGAAVAAGTITAASLAYLYSKKLENTPPNKWRCVGEVVDINCFPIKSCAPVKRKSFFCSKLGLQDGNLRDRVFMIVSPEGQFVTGRAQPKLLLVQPNVINDKLILSAPEKPDIEIDFRELRHKPASKTHVWHQEVNTIDTGDEVAEWLSTFVLGEKDGLRLVYYPETIPTRSVRKHNLVFKKLTEADVGALHDASSYMLINQSSMDELNSHLDHVVKPLQFRPNFVVKGPSAFEEDNWKWVRIGDNLVFRNIKPCTRCIFTNINPETALRNPKREPLTTLTKNRSILPDFPPVMGVHIGPLSIGTISIGDRIYVGDDS